MSEVWIADAAPLILLAKAGHLELLPALAQEILIPLAVVREIRKGPPDDPARLALTAGFGTARPAGRTPRSVQALGLLGAGERAVLSLALQHPGCRVLLDDRKGRVSADKLGLEKIGTLGVVLRARQQGLLSALVPVLHDLLAAGLYLDEATLRGAALAVGETWP